MFDVIFFHRSLKMKFLVFVVVALATFEAAAGLKCYTCKQGEEGTDVCVDGPGTSKECIEVSISQTNLVASAKCTSKRLKSRHSASQAFVQKKTYFKF